MAAYVEPATSSREEQEPLFRTTIANLEEVLRRPGSGDGHRLRILLGVSSHKRRRLGRDGRSLPNRSYDNVCILPRRQSSPF